MKKLILILFAFWLMPFKIHCDEKSIINVVRLHSVETGKFTCSGFVITNEMMITAAHCVAPIAPFLPPRHLSVRLADGQELGIEAEPLEIDYRADTAILIGDFSRFPKMVAEPRPAQIVDAFKSHRLIACGYPKGGKLYCSEFNFTSIFGFHMAGKGFLWPGMSGGPVIDLNTGRVVGLNSAVMGDVVLLATLAEIFADLNENK